MISALRRTKLLRETEMQLARLKNGDKTENSIDPTYKNSSLEYTSKSEFLYNDNHISP
jgi:hypothetical protein